MKKRLIHSGWKLKKYFHLIPTLLCLSITSLLNGCLSPASSPTPRFYTLQAMEPGQAAKPFQIPPAALIGIGPVNVPEYLNRPQIVTQGSNNLMHFAQFDRWGEPLEPALARVISKNLAVILSGATLMLSPWDLAIPVKYQVIMDVVKFESHLEGNLDLTIQWTVVDLETRKMLFVRSSDFHQAIAPRDYSGLAKTLSAECALLSAEIAAKLAEITAEPAAKKDATKSQVLP